MLRRLVFLLLLAGAATWQMVGNVAAVDNLKHALLYYTGAEGPPDSINVLVAERYMIGVTGLGIASNAVTIKDSNPDFQWYTYNSCSDTDISGDSYEDSLIGSVTSTHGWDHDVAFIHYYDDTETILQGETLSVPGWIGGSADSIHKARVPVYWSDLSRRVMNFSTFEGSQTNKEVIIKFTVDRVFDGTELYPDGVFLDNCAAELYNYGQIIEGGHVYEAPEHPKIGTNDFQEWWWNGDGAYGLGDFLTVLKDTMEVSSTWSQDSKQKYVMMNVANVWTDSYASKDVANILFLEFQYDPVRNPGQNAVQDAWRRDTVAYNAGISSFYSPCMKRTAPGYPGEISYGQALLGSLAWCLTTRTDSSWLFLMGTNAPETAGWDTLCWRGCVDTVQTYLGSPVDDPYIYQDGTDPLNNAYKVWGRNYDNGLVLVRPRGAWDEGITEETAVWVVLDSSLHVMDPDGVIGSPVDSISMRNGSGAILRGDAGPPPPDDPPIAEFVGDPVYGPAPLTVNFTDLSTNAPTSWSWDFGDDSTSSVQDPTHIYQAPGEYGRGEAYTVTLTATNEHGADDEVKVDYITVTDFIWFNSDWSYRAKITVKPDSIEGNDDLLDFHLYIPLTGDSLASVFASAKDDGSDLAVTEEDGLTLVDREVVLYDSTSQTGELWIEVDTLSKTQNVFYLYYGNPDTTIAASDGSAWDEDFLGVYHFGNSPADGYLEDSGINDNNGTCQGDWIAADTCDGGVGQGWRFDGTTHWIDGDSLSSSDSSYTFSAWLAVEDQPGDGGDIMFWSQLGYCILSAKRNETNIMPDYTGRGLPGDEGGTRSGAINFEPDPLPDSLLHYNLWSFDGEADTVRFFYDGIEQDWILRYTGPNNTSGKVYQGNQYGGDIGIASPIYGYQPDLMAGIVDEWWLHEGMRMSTAVLANYILTEYRNQKRNETFWIYGDEEENSEQPPSWGSGVVEE